MKTYQPPSNLDIWDAENAFYLYSSPNRIDKILSQFEIYRRILDKPGAIVECGVYKGASLMRLATFRRLLENDNARKIYGLDAFGMFPRSDVRSGADMG